MKQLSLIPTIVPASYSKKVESYLKENADDSYSYMSPQNVMDELGLGMEDLLMTDISYACCSCMSTIEVDGTCEHGRKSIHSVMLGI